MTHKKTRSRCCIPRMPRPSCSCRHLGCGSDSIREVS